MTNKKEIRTEALKWWRMLSDYEQQYLADKFHPKDDFFVTDTSSLRIENIYNLSVLNEEINE